MSLALEKSALKGYFFSCTKPQNNCVKSLCKNGLLGEINSLKLLNKFFSNLKKLAEMLGSNHKPKFLEFKTLKNKGLIFKSSLGLSQTFLEYFLTQVVVVKGKK